MKKYKRPIIDSFSGEYRWLSNFWECDIAFGNWIYSSVEAAYQAAKTLDESLKVKFVFYNPGKSKREGRKLKLRDDWELVKEEVMLELLRKKFYDPFLCNKLKATEDAILIEGNTWGDTYWGQCNGVGQNRLGEILMKIRKELEAGYVQKGVKL